MPSSLKIGEVARRAGVAAKAIRFYERSGVLPPAARGGNGYRLYGKDDVEMLAFLKRSGGLGLTLAELNTSPWKHGADDPGQLVTAVPADRRWPLARPE